MVGWGSGFVEAEQQLAGGGQGDWGSAWGSGKGKGEEGRVEREKMEEGG